MQEALRRLPRARARARARGRCVGLLGAQFVAIGALDVLYVVLAVSVLDLGGSGAGYLNAAFGAGGVVGIAVTVALVGRRRLLPAARARRRSSGAPRSRCSRAWPTVGGALLLLAVAGAGRIAARRRGPDAPAADRRRPTCSRASSACSKGSRWPASRSARC